MTPFTEEESKEAIRLLRSLKQKAFRYAESHKTGATATKPERLHDTVLLINAMDEAECFCNEKQDLLELLGQSIDQPSNNGVNNGVESTAP